MIPELDEEVKELRNKILDYHNYINYQLDYFISLSLSNNYDYFLIVRSFLQEINLRFSYKMRLLKDILNGKLGDIKNFKIKIEETKTKDLIFSFKNGFSFSKNDFFSRLDRLNKLRNKLAHNPLHFNRMPNHLRKMDTPYVNFMKKEGIENPTKTINQLEEDYSFLKKVFLNLEESSREVHKWKV